MYLFSEDAVKMKFKQAAMLTVCKTFKIDLFDNFW